MPRDVNGNYTLPAGNPVTPGTIIESIWANSTLNDIAAALTDSLSRSGAGGMLGSFRFADGAVGSPGISWNNEPTSGWYRASSGDFRYSILGTAMLKLVSGQVLLPDGTLANPGLAFISEASTGLRRAASNDMRLAVAGVDKLGFVAAGVYQHAPWATRYNVEEPSGLFLRGEHTAGAANARVMALQWIGDELAFGTVNDAETLYQEYIAFNRTNARVRSVAAGGFEVHNGTVPLFLTAANGTTTWYPPTPYDGSPFLNFNGVAFAISRAGGILNNTTYQAGHSSYSTGAIQLSTGDASASGYISWYSPDGSRQGYGGYASAGNMLHFIAETADGWGFGGTSSKQHVFSPEVNFAPKNSGVVTINMPDATSWNGLVIDQTTGGGSSTSACAFIWGGASIVGTIHFSSGGTTYNTFSDGRLKTEVEDLTGFGQAIDRMRAVRFKWRNTGKDGVGFIAQDVYGVAPEAVVPPKTEYDTWMMDYSRLMPYVVAELRDLRKRVKQLET